LRLVLAWAGGLRVRRVLPSWSCSFCSMGRGRSSLTAVPNLESQSDSQNLPSRYLILECRRETVMSVKMRSQLEERPRRIAYSSLRWVITIVRWNWRPIFRIRKGASGLRTSLRLKVRLPWVTSLR
jgi:hypothetical protein